MKGGCVGVSLFDMNLQNRIYNENKEKTLPRVRKCSHYFQKKKSKETPRCICISGSLTVEAAVIIPVMMCSFSFLLFYFRVMQTQLVVQSVLEETGRSLAMIETEKKDFEETEYLVLAKGMVSLKLKENALVEKYINGGILGISLFASEFKGDTIFLNANYKMVFPIKLVGDMKFSLSQKAVFRKWIGLREGLEKETGVSKDMVYVAEYGVVYHLQKNCPYLDLSIQRIEKDNLKNVRNYNGNKYKECKECKNGDDLSYVYVTTYGNKFHVKLECSGLKRTIFQKKLSEVGGMQACLKCSQ